MTDHRQYFEYLRHRSTLGAAYRRFWLYPKIVRRLSGRTLDIGCGIGDMLTFRRNTVGVDINEHTVDYCRSQGAEAYVMKVNELPFDDASFDSALLDNVLEHMEMPQALLAEVRRVIRPDGRLVVGVPGRRGWDSDPDHKVFYDETSLSRCMDEAGFERVEVFYAPLWRSDALSARVRQYCLYGVFRPRP